MCLPIRPSTTRDALVKARADTQVRPYPADPYDARRFVLSRENTGNFVRTRKVPSIATGERVGSEAWRAAAVFLLPGAGGALAVS